MKKAVAAAAIIIVAAASIAAVMLSMQPDYDAIIQDKDCDAVLGMQDWQLAGATPSQQIALGALAAACILGGPQ